LYPHAHQILIVSWIALVRFIAVTPRAGCWIRWLAGKWRGLSVAIKAIIFEASNEREAKSTLVATEAAIASNLNHPNIVATYSHDVKNMHAKSLGEEMQTFKFFLIQVRSDCTTLTFSRCALSATLMF
jgi:hypothetical protein